MTLAFECRSAIGEVLVFLFVGIGINLAPVRYATQRRLNRPENG
jgi:hypothetical protein